MDTHKLVLPAVALLGGAVLGRLIGIKGLVRAGMAAGIAVATLANVSHSAGLLSAGRRESNGRAVKRVTRKRSPQRKAATRKPASKSASVPAGTQTH